MGITEAYSISLDLLLDTSKAGKTIHEFQSSTRRKNKLIFEADINLKNTVDELEAQLGKLPKKWQRIGTEIKQHQKAIFNGQEIDDATRLVEKYADAYGNVMQRISYFKEKYREKITVDEKGREVTEKVFEGYNKLGVTTENLKQGVANLTTETRKYYEVVNDSNGIQHTAVVTEVLKEKFDSVGNSLGLLITRTKEYTDEQGRTNQIIEQFDEKGNRVGTTVHNITNAFVELNNSMQSSDFISRTGKSMETIINSSGNVQKNIVSLAKDGRQLRTEIETIVRGTDELVTKTRVYNNVTNEQISEDVQLVSGKKKVESALKAQKDLQRELNSEMEQTSTKTEKYVNSLGQIESKVTTIDKYNNEMVTTTKTYVDSLGQLIIETEKYNKTSGQTISNDKQIITDKDKIAKALKEQAKAQRELNGEAEKSSTDVHRYTKRVNGIKQEIKETKTLTENKEQLRKVETQYQDAQGTTHNITKQYKTVVDSLGNSTEVLVSETEKLTKDEILLEEIRKRGEQQVQRRIGLNQRLGQSFVDIIKKVTKFYIASLPIRTFQKALQETIQTVKDFDNALTEFRKVSDLSGASLDEYTAKLAKLGQQTGSTITAMVQASTEFKKSGFDESDSATLAHVAELYRNIADEELTAGESASFIIAQMKAFKIDAKDSIRIIDALNEVSNNYAVSSADLATNLGKVSSTLSLTGTSYEQSLGLLTGITEITRNASTASRGLKQISSRLTQVLDDSSSTGAKLRKIYADLEIELFDASGQIRSTYDILESLSEKWEDLDKNTQEYIALISAGANQVQNFTALMSNFGKVIEAVETAQDASGSAMRENEKVMQSLEKRIQLFQSEFQKLVTSTYDNLILKLLKGIVSFGTQLLKFANTDVGKTTTAVILLVSVLELLSKKLDVQVFIKYIDYLNKVQKSLLALGTKATYVDIVIGKLNKSITAFLSSPIGLIALAVSGIAMWAIAVQKLNSTYDEQKEKLEQIQNNLNEIQNEILESEEKIKTTINSLNDIEEKINDINKKELNVASKQQLQSLQVEKEELKSILEIEKTRLEVSKQKLEQEAKNTLDAKVKDTTKSWWNFTSKFNWDKNDNVWKNLGKQIGIGGGYTQFLVGETKSTQEKAIENITTAMEEQYYVVVRLTEKKKILEARGQTLSSKEEKELEKAKTKYKELSSYVTLYADNLSKTLPMLDKSSEEYERISKLLGNLGILFGKANETNEDYGLGSSLEDDEDAVDLFAQAVEKLNSQLEQLSNIDLSGIGDAFKTASQAQEELNSATGLSLDTYEALINLGEDYLSVLFDEEGNLRNTADAERELYFAKIDQMAITQAQALIDKAVAFENANVGQSYADLAGNIDTSTASLWDAVYANISLSGVTPTAQQALVKQAQALQKMAEQAKKNVSSYKGLNASTRKNTSATRANTSAQKENQQALSELKSQYDKVISYINSKLDKAISKLEEERDKELDIIDSQINALEEKKQKEEDYWNEKIDALKAQNEELESQLELEELLDNLAKAKAKKVRVYQNGQWVYTQDDDAVNEAKQKLDEYQRKKRQEDAIKELEKQRDSALAVYDKEIKDLEENRKKVEESYNKRIQFYKDYKEKFSDMVNSYEDEQNRLLTLQLTGIDFEQEGWEKRLDNLTTFVDKYKEILAQLEEAQKKSNDSSGSYSGGGGYYGGYDITGTEEQKKEYSTFEVIAERKDKKGVQSLLNLLKKTNPDKADLFTVIQKGNMSYVGLKSKQLYTLQEAQNIASKFAQSQANQKNPRKMMVHKFASGIASVSGNQIAITGENPNKEIVLGSKANGILTSIDNGGGVVNAQSTRTLAGLLNQLGSFATNNFGGAVGTLNNNSTNSNSTSINISNITLPKVTDGDSFVRDLTEKFRTYTISANGVRI